MVFINTVFFLFCDLCNYVKVASVKVVSVWKKVVSRVEEGGLYSSEEEEASSIHFCC